MQPDRPRHSHAACARLLDSLLIEPAALLAIVAGEGRELAPPSRPVPAASASRLSAEQQAVDLLGRALWDIFSDNHAVVDAGGTEYDLGSFRGSAGFIAESINRRYEIVPRAYDYMDFYMGSIGEARGSLLPLYRWIFAQLRERGCWWIYAFPRIQLIDFGDAEAEASFTEYDPGRSLQREHERSTRQAQIEELRRSLDEAHRDAVEQARSRPLPVTVAAYRDVFGELPEGWPHR
jgi:hypothetical protein